MKDPKKLVNLLGWLLTLGMVFLILNMFTGERSVAAEIDYTLFQKMIEKKEISEITIINERVVKGRYLDSGDKEEKSFERT